jgi:hypothetical protein
MTMTNTIAEWVSHFSRRPTPNYSPNYQYQIKYAGTEEILVQGGTQEIWADGIRLEEGFLLECKFIAKLDRSPFVEGSQIPHFIRDDIIADVKNEFSRYAAVINDPHTPVIGLEVIINEPRAVPFFQDLLNQYQIPGHVVVWP